MARPRAQLDTDALVRAFAPDGLHGTSVDRVAGCAGLAKPTLYQRGGDKEELFALAVEAEVERLIGRVDAACRAGIAGVADALDRYVHERPDGARLLLHTAHHQGSRVAERVERSLARMATAITDALDLEDAPLVTAALLGGAAGALHGGPSAGELAGLLTRALPDGSATPPELWTA